ncbi:hypothetical protein HYFRA_00009688 [Hymenoscyphus fraxineus]|uniref:Receptor L-domain domain-containing protein n=1 Tax=Hymenoscyphus fraxineus TaxID=746836 RepID=A0A9N9PSJ8_9HELO|nr:hypothetical protein HYFRA_00009688 [Hymenoscyphus fraxineus]
MFSIQGSVLKGFMTLLLLSSASGQRNICTLKPEESTFNSQNDVATRLAGCTTINGSLFISPKFEGTLALPGVEEILGNLEIATYHSSSEQEQNSQITSGLREITLDNLESVYEMDTTNAPNLEIVRMQSLSRASKLRFNSTRLTNVTMHELRQVDSIDFLGNFKEIGLGNLEIVNATLTIDSQAQEPPLGISIPSLHSAKNINISGNISSVDLGFLNVVQEKLVIKSTAPISIWLAGLINVTNIVIDGNFTESLNFPNLLQIFGDSSFRMESPPKKPVSLEFDHLATAGALDVHGNIADVFLGAGLHQINGAFSIRSNATMKNCDKIQTIWDQAQKGPQASSFTCQGAPVPASSKSRKLGLGIGIGLGVPFLLLCIFLCWFCVKRRARAAPVLAQPAKPQES